MAHRLPGPAPQVEKREQFVRLIARGVPNSEACRIVGINRRTGTRWRFGRTITSSGGKPLHYAPVISTPAPEISPRFLSEDETALHFFDAPSAETLNEAGKRPALPFERIVEAVEGAPSPKEET